MIDSLLGVELPLPVKLIVAFVIVLALIALATWVFRRIGGERVGPSIGRGRQPRLAVIDAASVDGRRRLVLVRRDNVEHLIMIGGPSDIVIEQNIVRAVPVAPPGPRPMAEPTVRPVTPEAAPPRAATEPYRERAAAEPRPRLEPLPRTPRAEPARLASTEPPAVPRPARAAPARRVEPEPRRTQLDAEGAHLEAHGAASGPDTSLADMASKLEAALRRAPPRPEPELQGPTPPTVPAAEPAGPPKPQAPVAATPAPAPAEPAPPAVPAAPGADKAVQAGQEKDKPPANGKDSPGAKSMFDSLEEEMASLLGRPPGKS